MGNSFNKMIGYALTDVNVKNYKIVDKRINPNSLFVNDEVYMEKNDLAKKENTTLLEQYYDHLVNKENNSDENNRLYGLDRMYISDLLSKNEKHVYWNNYVHMNLERLPNTLCVLTFEGFGNGWSRRNDILDSYDDLPDIDDDANIKYLRNGIYPFSSEYVDKLTGEKMVNSYDVLFFVRAKNDLKDSKKLDIDSNQAKMELYANNLGMTVEEACERIVPAIPHDIKTIVEWGELFTDKKYVNDLKPVLIKYWS